jgi:large repetitive protein
MAPVTLTVSGGATPYTYAWSGPNGFTATTKDLDNLAPGEYTVIVTDANGCQASTSVTVAQQDSDITVQLTATPTICEAVNGSITLTVSDGLAPYTYLWSGPDDFTSTSQNLTGLANGTYSVVVTDANGCEGTASIEVIKDLTAIGITAVHTPTLCAASNGTVTLTVSGGATPYTYAWSGPGGFTAATKDLDNLAPGEYTVIVTDANGCQASTSVTVAQQDSDITVQLTATPTICEAVNGSITLTVSDGLAPYTYLWSGPGWVYFN